MNKGQKLPVTGLWSSRLVTKFLVPRFQKGRTCSSSFISTAAWADSPQKESAQWDSYWRRGSQQALCRRLEPWIRAPAPSTAHCLVRLQTPALTWSCTSASTGDSTPSADCPPHRRCCVEVSRGKARPPEGASGTPLMSWFTDTAVMTVCDSFMCTAGFLVLIKPLFTSLYLYSSDFICFLLLCVECLYQHLL